MRKAGPSLTFEMRDAIKRQDLAGWREIYRSLQPTSQKYALRQSYHLAITKGDVETCRTLRHEFGLSFDECISNKNRNAMEIALRGRQEGVAQMIWAEATESERERMTIYRNLCFAASYGMHDLFDTLEKRGAYHRRTVQPAHHRPLARFAVLSEDLDMIRKAAELAPEEFDPSLFGYVANMSVGRPTTNSWGRGIRPIVHPDIVIDHLSELGLCLDTPEAAEAFCNGFGVKAIRKKKMTDQDWLDYSDATPYLTTLCALRGMPIDRSSFTRSFSRERLSEEMIDVIEELRKAQTHIIDVDALREQISDWKLVPNGKCRDLWKGLVNRLEHDLWHEDDFDIADENWLSRSYVA